MSDDLGELSVSFSANLDSFMAGVQAAIEQLNQFADAAQSISSFAGPNVEGLVGVAEGAEEAESNLDQLQAQLADAQASLASMQAQAEQGIEVTGISDVEAQIASLEDQIAAATSDLADMEDQAEETGSAAEDAAEPVSGFNLNLLGLGDSLVTGAIKLQMFAQMAEQTGEALVGPAAQAEQTSVAFTTLMGSTQAANAELEKLNTFAGSTPFQTQAIDAGAEKLLAFGFNSKVVIPDIQAIGDALSALGEATPDKLSSVIDIFGKIQASGKLTGQDMTQLATYGIPAWKDLSAALGIPVTKLQEMVSKGAIPASTALSGLQEGLEKAFGGGMEKQAETFNGQLSTLQSNATIAWASFTGPALQMAEAGLSKLGALAASPQFQQFAKIAGQDMAGALTKLASGISTVVTDGAGIVSFFQHNQTAMNALDAVLISTAGVIAGVVIPAMFAWAAAMIPVALETMLTIGPYILVGIAVAAVVFGIIEAIQHWSQIMSWIGGICGDIGSAVGSVFSSLGSLIHGAIGAIGQDFSDFGTIMHTVWDGVVGVVKGAINGIIGDINDFIGFIDGIQIHIPSFGIGSVSTPAINWNGLGIPKIPLLAQGGEIPPGGFGIAGETGQPEIVYGGSGGATVVGVSQTAAMFASARQAQPQHIHIYLGGQEIAQAMVDPLGNAIVSAVRSQGPVGRIAA